MRRTERIADRGIEDFGERVHHPRRKAGQGRRGSPPYCRGGVEGWGAFDFATASGWNARLSQSFLPLDPIRALDGFCRALVHARAGLFEGADALMRATARGLRCGKRCTRGE